MEVTRKNFKQALPLVSASIKKADFLAIDTEFTGLINGRDVSIFDTPEEYYTTLYNGTSDFLLIQFGLCAFYWDDDKQHYMNDAYNFYLFPRGRPGPEKIFLCQSSSLDFLSSQGFDFNKLIKEGISYMTEPTETKLREKLLERQSSYTVEKDVITIPAENRQQIDDICKQVRRFLDDTKNDEMEIDRCNAFIRRLLFQELRSQFKNEAFVETKILENKDRVLKVTRLTSENEMKSRDTQRKEKELEEFEEAVGFSRVARMISTSEKLVIGHNMLLDVMHTLNHFFQPLPSEYKPFKEFAHCMFPRLLDTKYMTSLPPFKDKVNSSVLQHLLVTLSEDPFSLPTVESEEGRGYSQTEDKHHEAGYDAYVTGLCFLSMQAAVSRMRGEGGARVCADAAALRPFLNKLYLARTAHQHSPYMNLAGADPTPPRDHVFHLTFPKDWQRNDINELFSPFGNITVQFVDDTSALVALWRREQAKDVMRALAKSKKTTLVPYATYKTALSKLTSSMPKKKKTQADDDSDRQLPSTPDLKMQVAKSPNRMARVRSVSMTSPSSTAAVTPPAAVTSPPLVSNRKRTSSGVFQIDESEPQPKKPEPSKEIDHAAPKKSELNGNRKVTEKPDQERVKILGKDKEKVKEKKPKEKYKETSKQDKEIKVVDRFDSDSNSKTKCVTAFKESDNWD